MGNRTSSHLSASYQYDPANRLLAEDTVTYTSDANGNRITQTRQRDHAPTRYTYDIENSGATLPISSTASHCRCITNNEAAG